MYSTENYELDLRAKFLKNSKAKKENLEKTISELTKMKNQINTMNNLNKKLKEQYAKLVSDVLEKKNNVDNQNN